MGNFVVGLTGGIGSGKTAVTDRFTQLGILVVDADVASRVVVEPGQPALDSIKDHFGAAIILKDGNMDRALMREIVFKDPGEKTWLEQLLHPLINEQIERDLEASTTPYSMLVSPLLIEIGQTRFTHRVLVVDVPVEVQIQRTVARDNNSEEQVRAIINAQLSREARLEEADDVIVNDGDFAKLDLDINGLHDQYLQLAEERR
ncbi:MAG: dephospho-CoA kinase [Pseudomonadales bacterium]|jgi:dephospho-CoA kinase|nr:dephospho-CoA kinase [Pseudomonadales bacterium]MDP7359357.1 dephospho-CoA kinase [Pseudomonadales bacterium]MDP7594671.1 dephospho-CoA kinase [Pseudomonadales bacterium]HJN50363.1 dephospho-CoA kinase [Pseudomonadales bacterium]|tara:strand:+ start:228 stop:836 length:609 start_codon:yes stop_codon:yes gene_type:complete